MKKNIWVKQIFVNPPYNFLRFKNKLTKIPTGIKHFYNQANPPDRIKTKNSIGIIFPTTAPLCPTLLGPTPLILFPDEIFFLQ